MCKDSHISKVLAVDEEEQANIFMHKPLALMHLFQNKVPGWAGHLLT